MQMVHLDMTTTTTTLLEKHERLSLELDEILRQIQIGLLQDQSNYSDRQEPTLGPTNNIESKLDNRKSDDEMHHFLESVETESFVDDLSQAQQQQESQHQTVEVQTVETIVQEWLQLQLPEQEQPMSSHSPIKTVDIYAMQEELKWSMISEIEGQMIEPVADY